MKYFSFQTVENAYKGISAKTNNKFWGIIDITSSVGSMVIPQKVYPLDINNVSNLLENQFCLSEQVRVYNRDYEWNVVFSNSWADYISEKLLRFSPNIYDVLVWYFRREKFEDNITNQQLIAKFLESTNISIEIAKRIFVFDEREITFASAKYSEAELLKRLSNICNNSTTYTTITAEKTFVASDAGELSRAPFVQTLYAGQGALECMILTQFDFRKYYGNVASQGQNSLHLIDKDIFSRQIIYFGAPGTGKSFRVEQITEQYGDDVIRTTFHPDSDYSTFVGCYKPSMESIPQTYTVEGKEKPIIGKNGEQVAKKEIVYSFVPQAFTQAYTRAWLNPDKPIFLVIEELNRGNCAQIFGDIFQLLDRNANNESAYSIIPDHDLQQHLATEFKNAENIPSDIKEAKAMRLPANLYIWATMNTSDQSLFPIDSAFKRRWIWKYIPIANAELGYKIQVGNHQYDWWNFVEKVNGEIEGATKSEDKKLGYFFAKADNNIIAADTFVSKVVFYLWNDVFKDSYDKTIFKNDLTFHKFFQPNGDPKTEVIDQFMHDLDLKVDGEE